MAYTFEEVLERSANAFYVFDVCELKNRIEYIRNKMPKDVALCYAVKANTFVVKEIVEQVERFEICSPGEAEICTCLQVPSEKMVISGVYKSAVVMEQYIGGNDFDGIFTAESVEQFRLLSGLSKQYKKRIKLLLRLTNDSQFGMDESDIEKIIRERQQQEYVDILGIQYFSGTQKSSVKKYKREITYLDQFLQKLKQEYGYEAKELEYGTGFPVSYFESDKDEEVEIFDSFAQVLGEMVSPVRITLEIGRSMVASCGKYYTHIVDIKSSKQQNYVLIDGGMHQLTYFGQYMAMKKPILSVCGKETIEENPEWVICGSLCTMNDIVAKQVKLPKIEVGDVMCFERTGAYCMTEGISLFLSRDLPAIYLKKDESQYICVRESYETRNLNMPSY